MMMMVVVVVVMMMVMLMMICKDLIYYPSASVVYEPRGCKSSSVLARAHDLRHFGSILAASPSPQYQACVCLPCL